jgi:hypothetical protein
VLFHDLLRQAQLRTSLVECHQLAGVLVRQTGKALDDLSQQCQIRPRAERRQSVALDE